MYNKPKSRANQTIEFENCVVFNNFRLKKHKNKLELQAVAKL